MTFEQIDKRLINLERIENRLNQRLDLGDFHTYLYVIMAKLELVRWKQARLLTSKEHLLEKLIREETISIKNLYDKEI